MAYFESWLHINPPTFLKPRLSLSKRWKARLLPRKWLYSADTDTIKIRWQTEQHITEIPVDLLVENSYSQSTLDQQSESAKGRLYSQVCCVMYYKQLLYFSVVENMLRGSSWATSYNSEYIPSLIFHSYKMKYSIPVLLSILYGILMLHHVHNIQLIPTNICLYFHMKQIFLKNIISFLLTNLWCTLCILFKRTVSTFGRQLFHHIF